MKTFRVGDQVKYEGRKYEVIDKRFGLNHYRIAKVDSRYSNGTPSKIHDDYIGLYADQLQEVHHGR